MFAGKTIFKDKYQFFNKTSWSDETTFKLSNSINTIVLIDRYVVRWTRLTVGLSSFGVLALHYFVDRMVTGAVYIWILQNNAIPGFRCTLNNLMKGYLQHTCDQITPRLFVTFQTKQSKTGLLEDGSITPMDFFLWDDSVCHKTETGCSTYLLLFLIAIFMRVLKCVKRQAGKCKINAGGKHFKHE